MGAGHFLCTFRDIGQAALALIVRDAIPLILKHDLTVIHLRLLVHLFAQAVLAYLEHMMFFKVRIA